MLMRTLYQQWVSVDLSLSWAAVHSGCTLDTREYRPTETVGLQSPRINNSHCCCHKPRTFWYAARAHTRVCPKTITTLLRNYDKVTTQLQWNTKILIFLSLSQNFHKSLYINHKKQVTKTTRKQHQRWQSLYGEYSLILYPLHVYWQLKHLTNRLNIINQRGYIKLWHSDVWPTLVAYSMATYLF